MVMDKPDDRKLSSLSGLLLCNGPPLPASALALFSPAFGLEESPSGIARKLQRCAGTKRQVAADGQLADAVNQRPGGPGQRQQIAQRKIARGLRGGHTVKQNLKGIAAHNRFVRAARNDCILLRAARQIEHHDEVLRPAQSKVDVAAAAQLQAFKRRLAARHPLPHRRRKPLKALGGDCVQQLILARKVTIRRVVRDAGASRNLAQSKGARTNLADQSDGGIEQRLAEIRVVVEIDAGHIFFYQVMLTVATGSHSLMLSVSTLNGISSQIQPGENMAKGVAYKQTKLQEVWDAIVIGSGMGGLTAAVLLGAHGGKRVLLLERHSVAGGFTHTFQRPGYKWDVGLHYIGQMQDESSPVRRAFDHVTAGNVRWQAMPEVYDRLNFAGKCFDLYAGLEHLRDGLMQSFPGEARAIDDYIAAVLACNRASGLYYAEKAIPAPLAAAVGRWMRASYMRWARRTTREVIESMTENRELIGVLTAQWGDYGLPPAQSSFAIHATVAEHYFDGASYPVGGSGAIAEAMLPQIEASGGCVVIGAEVASILLDGNKAVGVRMSDGRQFRARTVLSDAGAANTFERMLPPNLPAIDPLRKKLRRLAPSTAHLCLYVGLSQSDAALGLSGTNLWLYPTCDHDANVQRFAREFAQNPDAEFPGVYISFPSAKDPTFALQHPGKSTVEVLALVPYAAFSAWQNSSWRRRGDEYDARKQHLATRLLAELQRQLPSVAGNIACAEMSTPITTRHFMNYAHGEIYGVAATPARFALRELGARTPIRGLYLTGQDAASLGIVGAMFGGVICASAILGKNLTSVVTHSSSKLGS